MPQFKSAKEIEEFLKQNPECDTDRARCILESAQATEELLEETQEEIEKELSASRRAHLMNGQGPA